MAKELKTAVFQSTSDRIPQYHEIPTDGDWYVAELVKSLGRVAQRQSIAKPYVYGIRNEALPSYLPNHSRWSSSRSYDWGKR